jgi:hypothetical protein
MGFVFWFLVLDFHYVYNPNQYRLQRGVIQKGHLRNVFPLALVNSFLFFFGIILNSSFLILVFILSQTVP